MEKEGRERDRNVEELRKRERERGRIIYRTSIDFE